jgi:hypothetical protein
LTKGVFKLKWHHRVLSGLFPSFVQASIGLYTPMAAFPRIHSMVLKIYKSYNKYSKL